MTPVDEIENTHRPGPEDLSDLSPSIEQKTYPLLFRVTNGKADKSVKEKYTTVVAPEDLDTFWKNYAEAVKSGVAGLKKKDKKKKSSSKKKSGKGKKK